MNQGIRRFLDGVVGQMNADLKPEWITERRGRVQTRRSSEPDGEHGEDETLGNM